MTLPRILAVFAAMCAVGIAASASYPHFGIAYRTGESYLLSTLIGIILGLIGIYILIRWEERSWGEVNALR